MLLLLNSNNINENENELNKKKKSLNLNQDAYWGIQISKKKAKKNFEYILDIFILLVSYLTIGFISSWAISRLFRYYLWWVWDPLGRLWKFKKFEKKYKQIPLYKFDPLLNESNKSFHLWDYLGVGVKEERRFKGKIKKWWKSLDGIASFEFLDGLPEKYQVVQPLSNLQKKIYNGPWKLNRFIVHNPDGTYKIWLIPRKYARRIRWEQWWSCSEQYLDHCLWQYICLAHRDEFGEYVKFAPDTDEITSGIGCAYLTFIQDDWDTLSASQKARYLGRFDPKGSYLVVKSKYKSRMRRKKYRFFSKDLLNFSTIEDSINKELFLDNFIKLYEDKAILSKKLYKLGNIGLRAEVLDIPDWYVGLIIKIYMSDIEELDRLIKKHKTFLMLKDLKCSKFERQEIIWLNLQISKYERKWKKKKKKKFFFIKNWKKKKIIIINNIN